MIEDFCLELGCSSKEKSAIDIENCQLRAIGVLGPYRAKFLVWPGIIRQYLLDAMSVSHSLDKKHTRGEETKRDGNGQIRKHSEEERHG